MIGVTCDLGHTNLDIQKLSFFYLSSVRHSMDNDSIENAVYIFLIYCKHNYST